MEIIDRLYVAIPHIPIILLCAVEDEAVANAAMQRGAQDFLLKERIDDYVLPKMLAAAIDRDFGSFAKLQNDFNAAALKVFGSGWAMVLVDGDGKLTLVSRPNQDSPLLEGKRVVFGNDVWEHAYYLKYQNRRADYLAAWWSVLHWPRIGARYAAARAGVLTV